MWTTRCAERFHRRNGALDGIQNDLSIPIITSLVPATMVNLGGPLWPARPIPS